MLACKLISSGQTLALRRSRTIPVTRELAPIPEGGAALNDEQDEEDEVPLVRRKWPLEVARDPDADRIQSGAAAGPSGQGNPYLFRDLDRAVVDLRLARFNPSQLVHRHQDDLDLNLTLLQCVDQMVLPFDMSHPRGTVAVDNTLAFRSAFFEEYGTNLRSWPSLLEGVVAPGLRQYVEESSPEANPEPEPLLIRKVINLESPIEALRPEVVAIDSSSSLEGEEMAQPGDNVLQSIFQGGNPPSGSSGPLVKKPRFTKKTPPGPVNKSPTKGRSQGPAAVENMPPPPPLPPVLARDQETPTRTPPTPTPTVRIPVNTQALEKLPETFRGTVYETASYMVEHYYNATLRDLREIEMRSLENVMESSLGMNLTTALALHRSIAWSRARFDEIKGEFQTAQAALSSALQQERDAKAALTAVKENEKVAQVALTATKTDLEAAQGALATTKIDLEAAQAGLATTKAELEEAKAALVAERASSSSSMEAMLYYCWAFNQDGDFSFLAPEVWEPFLEKFKARLQQEAPSETGETSAAGE
ncbi:uncharacterized protein LOC133807277 [Humulus lupulus]|uniref:uncharacterized protein LOC133807277 n=1 Tax=Humulus lupulus TaxID=3486 RepID=UPI002B403D8B|nr:uncharacterized protein LOC133807277 [Humulus lupulus]